MKRYNTGDSYVLITGCTAGLGEAMAHKFAKEGFNIVLVSRSMDKLKKVEDDIQKETQGKIKTRIVQADFSKGQDMKLYERIADEVKDLDICILVNNAGILYNGYHRDLDVK